MVLAPVAGVKSRGGFVGPTGRVKPFNPRDDGDKKELVTGESAKETVKTIAQGRPDDTADTCGDDPVLSTNAQGPRVQRAPGLPCALVISRVTTMASTRGDCRPRARTCILDLTRLFDIQICSNSRGPNAPIFRRTWRA